MRITIFAIMALLVIASAFAFITTPVHAQGATGTISGQIANGTKDAKPASVQNLQVRLFGIDASATHPISATTQSDQERFS